MAVGIGKDIKTSELEIIAGDKSRVINAESFEDLSNQLDDIREASCSKCISFFYLYSQESKFLRNSLYANCAKLSREKQFTREHHKKYIIIISFV